MKAGFGKGEIIFPEELFPLEGFCGVHDNPHVRIMVLAFEQLSMAIAAMELVNVPKRELNYCREQVSNVFGIDKEQVWVHMTHAITTPHEPGPMGPPDKRPPLTEEDQKKRELFYGAIEHAVDEAIASAKQDYGEAVLGWGKGECHLAVNRDVETPWGWWIGAKGNRPSNPRMMVLRVEDTCGGVKGAFVSYGIKPCAIDNSGMKDNSRLVSSEICGVASMRAEDELKAPVLFVMSAAGDQIPKKTSLYDEVVEGEILTRDEGVKAGLSYAKELGNAMGEAILEIAGKAVCKKPEEKTAWAYISFDWEKRGGGPRRVLTKQMTNEPTGDTVQFTSEIFVVGDTAFVAERPEVNAQTELELIEASPFTNTILMSMVNGELKYLPDRWSVEHSTWEAQSSALMPGAAEKFVEEAVKKLTELYIHIKEEI